MHTTKYQLYHVLVHIFLIINNYFFLNLGRYDVTIVYYTLSLNIFVDIYIRNIALKLNISTYLFIHFKSNILQFTLMLYFATVIY